MTQQIEAVTGRRIPNRYRSMITAQAAHLPEVYAAKERRTYQDKMTNLREEELTLSERGQAAAEKRAGRATTISAMGMGAMVGAYALKGGAVGGPWGAAIGAGVGLIASLF